MEPTLTERTEEDNSVAISEEDISTTKTIFEEISHRAKDCSALVAALTEKVKRKEMSTAKVCTNLRKITKMNDLFSTEKMSWLL